MYWTRTSRNRGDASRIARASFVGIFSSRFSNFGKNAGELKELQSARDRRLRLNTLTHCVFIFVCASELAHVRDRLLVFNSRAIYKNICHVLYIYVYSYITLNCVWVDVRRSTYFSHLKRLPSLTFQCNNNKELPLLPDVEARAENFPIENFYNCVCVRYISICIARSH